MSTYKLLPAFFIQHRSKIEAAQLSRLLLVCSLLSVALFAVGVGSAYTSLVALSAAMVAVGAFRFSWSKYVLIFVCYLTSFWAIAEAFVGLPPLAWTGNVNLVGYIAAAGLLVVLSNRWYLLAVPCLCALLISNCAGAALTVVLAFLWRYRARWWVVAAGIVAAGLVLFFNGLDVERLRLLADVFLSGFRIIGNSHVAFSCPKIWHTHNLILQSLSVMGVLPTLCISVVVCLFLAVARLNSDVIVWLLVSSAVDFIYWWPGILVVAVLFVIWGMSHEV